MKKSDALKSVIKIQHEVSNLRYVSLCNYKDQIEILRAESDAYLDICRLFNVIAHSSDDRTRKNKEEKNERF